MQPKLVIVVCMIISELGEPASPPREPTFDSETKELLLAQAAAAQHGLDCDISGRLALYTSLHKVYIWKLKWTVRQHHIISLLCAVI